MNEVKRKVVLSCEINTTIFDEDLGFKVLEKIKETNLKLNNEYYYRLEVTFDLKSYDNKDGLFNFVIKNKKDWEKQNDEKDKIYLMLSQQLDEISANLKNIGFDFSSSNIIGDEINNLNIVIINVMRDDIKQYNKKGQLTNNTKVNTIMPSYPGFIENFTRAFTEILEKQKDIELRKELEIKNHIPNFVKTELLMESIANGLFLDNKSTKSKKGVEISDKKQSLLRTCKINSEFPLDISGNFDCVENKIVEQVDCPEILIYKEYNNGFWTINKVDYLKEVEYEITKDGYCRKDIKDVVVLRNLKPLPFLLINKEYVGMTIIKKTEANKYKKLEVCWK
jgi:hypothetical protein